MAYVDKSCDMRRCCIAKGGHVQFEGVAFDDGDFIFRNRDGFGELPTISKITNEELIQIIRDYNNSYRNEDSEEPLILLYQDEEESFWDVKKSYIKKVKKKVKK